MFCWPDDAGAEHSDMPTGPAGLPSGEFEARAVAGPAGLGVIHAAALRLSPRLIRGIDAEGVAGGADGLDGFRQVIDPVVGVAAGPPHDTPLMYSTTPPPPAHPHP